MNPCGSALARRAAVLTSVVPGGLAPGPSVGSQGKNPRKNGALANVTNGAEIVIIW